MAIVEVSSLLQGISREQAVADLEILAKALKFTSTSFRIGSKFRFYLLAAAEVASRCSVQIALIAAQGFNSTAYGNALGKFSKSRFNNPPIKAIKTQGTVYLEDTGGTGPHTIAVGTRVFKYDNDPSITYRNITGGVLAAGGTIAGGTALALTVEAETGGGAWNVDIDTISSMSPVIAGVDVSNPGDVSGEWITRPGADAEADTVLKTRNAAKWATLGGNAPRDAYKYWALNATENPNDTGDPVGITRAEVDDQNPDGPGTLRVYIADDTGAASGAQITDVQEYIDARKTRTAVVTVLSANVLPITIIGTFRCSAGLGATLKTQIEQAITDYINALQIGGTDIGETLGRVVWSRMIEIAMAFDGVEHVAITTPSGDVSLQKYEIATVASVSFTATEI
jgi:phage-related baseplate assembly protein